MSRDGRRIGFWDALKLYPPYYVRLLAKKRNGRFENLAKSHAEIAADSDWVLTHQRVMDISHMADWSQVTIKEFRAFTRGCGFDPTDATDRTRINQYQYVCRKRRRYPFLYLKRSPLWNVEFLPLIRMRSDQLRAEARAHAATAA